MASSEWKLSFLDTVFESVWGLGETDVLLSDAIESSGELPLVLPLAGK